MKNRLIITISDINGSRQYSVHEIIKKIIFLSVLTALSIGVGTFYYIKLLNNETTLMKDKISQLNSAHEALEEKNQKLKISNSLLKTNIEKTSAKLISLNKELRVVEEMIGLGPDIDRTLFERIESAKEIGKKFVENKISQATDSLKIKAKTEKISAIQKALIINSIPNGEPLAYRRISSPFGYRIHPVTKTESFHAGIDLSAKRGTPIYAPASGMVVFAQNKGAYGNFLLITHSYGFQTAYGHLNKYAVKRGDFVTKGQVIAYVGNTGRSTGPHLHYEIRYLTQWINPKIFMDWDLDNINTITDKITKVNWESIFAHTKQLINLATK